MKEISLQTLLEAGCHFGHQTVRWNPKMRPYIYMAREGIHIFDLAKTKEGLEEALAYIKTVAAQGGKILLVGTKRQAREVIEATAKEVEMPYINQRWLGGTLTNFDQLKKSIDKLKEMRAKRAAGEYREFTKKEQLLIDREIIKFERFLSGLVSLDHLPEAVFVVDIKKESSAAKEAQRRGVKVVAMVDTNANPDLADYLIPTNDDASKAVDLIVKAVGEAILEGKKQAKVKADKEEALKDKKAKKESAEAEKSAIVKTMAELEETGVIK